MSVKLKASAGLLRRGSYMVFSTQPHFVRDYRKHVAKLLKSHDSDAAMELAVGTAGSYASVGHAETTLLKSLGLKDTATIIDVGCGSGRLASVLASMPGVTYIGTDVVPELLNYAEAKCGRPDWRFVLVSDLTMPVLDGSADFVVFFSVLTHLTELEGIECLREARRVIKSNGQIVVSFIDKDIAPWPLRTRLFASQWLHRMFGRGFKVTLARKSQLKAMANKLKLSVRFVETPWSPKSSITQYVCVFRLGNLPE
jgi:ubiquinone/menaquinone biosynthesis C-methylase UbiE